VQCRPVR